MRALGIFKIVGGLTFPSVYQHNLLEASKMSNCFLYIYNLELCYAFTFGENLEF